MKLDTGHVDVGLSAFKRIPANEPQWVCERCGENAKKDPKPDAKPPCKSKSGNHKWIRV